MIPNIQILGREFTAYTLIALAGVLVILFFTRRLAEKRGLDDSHMLYMLLFAFIGVLVGGHLLYAITNISKLVYILENLHEIDSFDAFIHWVSVIFGGSVYYGGLIGALLVCMIYLKHNKLPPGTYADTAAPAIPLFHFFGRLGCFLSGCCYGIEWQHGFVYEHSMAEGANGIQRFPVQLVEAVLNLILFFVMYGCLKKGRLKNKLLALYLTVYPVYRFALEFLRGDTYRGFIGVLSTSQVISIGILICMAVFWSICAVKLRKKTH